MDACFVILGDINYLAVIVCAVIAMFIGAFWYSPVLFGNQWMKAIGFKPEDIKKGDSSKGMIVSTVTSFIEALVLAAIIIMTGTKSFGSGLHIGAMISIGFIVMVTLSNTMFEKRPIKLWGINSSYRILYFMINGGILAVWK